MLASQECVRFKELASDVLFDVKLVEEDVVLVRQVSTSLQDTYLMNVEDFVELFDEYYGPQ